MLAPYIIGGMTGRHYDDRGYFKEVLRQSDSVGRHKVAFKQVSIAETYPGVIKAFHLHGRQWDYWYLLRGRVQVKLINQETKQKKTYYLSEENAGLLVIPPGWLHGYRVLGSTAAHMLYLVTEEYDEENPDEKKFPPDVYGTIWETINR